MFGDMDCGGIIPKCHKFYNFSLMPVSGGMNNKKGNFKYHDIFNEFLLALKEFYMCNKDDQDKYVKEYLWYNRQYNNENMKTWTWLVLVDYLNLFENFNDYCQKIYLLNEEEMKKIWYTEKSYADKVQDYLDIKKRNYLKSEYVKNG